ncbi:phosphoenolpyruvate synthase/pyruvate phosphate dikinase [Thermoplasmatales archaeon SCGC AB-539-N05]|nr:phosphoenolpyruvate synthase/pyruvate phosphate dikinase [Thermoplasmatales archaeon SCGC AB-539-N05]
MGAEDTCIDISQIQKTDEGGFDQTTQAFHTLMPFKVRELLLVSSTYDAFIVEEEGLISELVIEEYRHLLLSSPPRVTQVTSGKQALAKVKNNKYDLVITMSKNIGMDPFEFGKKIKKECPDLPVIVLATDTADLHVCQEHVSEGGIDKAFFWYGDTSLFMVIVKYVEDKVNVKYDTVNGNVQVIIVLEDSIRDYSMLLPVIYSEIVQQTQRSISDDLNEMQRLLRRRARPKIILTDNYEEGIALYNKYRTYILGVISDVKFPKTGKLDPQAGHDFIQHVKNDNPYVPTMLQSKDPKNRERAEKLGAFFIHKNSPSLMQDFNRFMLKHLGFGDFVFLLPKKVHKKGEKDETHHEQTEEITRASNLKEFECALQKIPLESIRFHANRNDFSNWLMARGEFKLAMKLRPAKVSDFNTLEENRRYLVNVFNEYRRERQLGIMTEFELQKFEFDSSYTRIGSDSLGGKGRGIAFIRTLLSRYNFQQNHPDVHIIVPSTVAIGTDEFDKFISENNLHDFVNNNKDLPDSKIAEQFLKGELSKNLKQKLTAVLKHFKKPLAVRSSSLLEDSQNYPFAGMYSTYMLPNSHKDNKIRLEQLCQSIKLIYASVFYQNAKAYIEATSAKIEEEKMAVIIQELIGDEHSGRFYPTFSGVAQSYNYYPVSYQKREEGIASIAVGLGFSVVGGEKVLRFSPYHPEVIPDLSTPAMILQNTQQDLYILNTKKQPKRLSEKDTDTLEKINISEITKDGTLDYITSTYDRNDGMIRDNFSKEGPHLVTFAGVLKYDAFPLASILKDILVAGQKSMGSPVEIEFAVNFDTEGKKPPVFAVIQIRPLVISQEQANITWDEEDVTKEDTIIHSNQALGNGVIDSIKDIVYVSPETFNSAKTAEIANEVGEINKILTGKPYILIGPGRWGTQDPWLGIPVTWRDISNVKIMIETALENYNIKPTQGTHFFQNITSRGIGYINITLKQKESMIDWKWLKNQKTANQLKYVKHVKLSKPLSVKLDGKNGKALITKPE